MERSTDGLPAGAAGRRRRRLGSANAVAEQLGGRPAARSTQSAETAFTGAMGTALDVASARRTRRRGVRVHRHPAAEREPAEQPDARGRPASRCPRERAGGEKPPARPRGRPRSAEADNAIFGAVLQLLPETGLKGLTMEAVAKKAGRQQGDGLQALVVEGGARDGRAHRDPPAPARRRGHGQPDGRPRRPRRAADRAARQYGPAAADAEAAERGRGRP